MNVADLVINVSRRFSRSAGFQPAVSPISNRQIVVKRIVEGSDDPQAGSLRYSRLETCATSKGDSSALWFSSPGRGSAGFAKQR